MNWQLLAGLMSEIPVTFSKHWVDWTKAPVESKEELNFDF
jgi:hypothetical protein